jgi:Haem-NO-binding
MKGIVFTEFLEMVEDRFSPAMADRMLEACALPSGGVYTAVGTYDHHEMVQLVSQLSTLTGVAVPELLRTYGQHLFGRFVHRYPHFFAGVDSAFAFLHNIEGYIHVEVRKLYPEADLFQV